MANAQRIRDRTDEVVEQAAAERAWWDEKRKRSERELLGEVNSDEDGVLVEKRWGYVLGGRGVGKVRQLG